jgi:hypothetical protein
MRLILKLSTPELPVPHEVTVENVILIRAGYPGGGLDLQGLVATTPTAAHWFAWNCILDWRVAA